MKLGKYENWIPGFEGRYSATESGKIFHHYKSVTPRELKGYLKGNSYCVKLNGKEYNFNRIIWETFKGPIPEGYLVTRKLNILDQNYLANLQLKTKAEHGKKTGPKAKSKAVVLMDENGNVIDSWTSARKAAKDLFCSYQTVMDYCNKKVKKPMINVRWERGIEI